MTVFTYLTHKVGEGNIQANEVQFAYDIGAITDEERTRLHNLQSNIYFGAYKQETLREKLQNLLNNEEFDDSTAFNAQEWV